MAMNYHLPRNGANINSSSLTKLINVIHLKERKFLSKKHVDPETVLELIELYLLMLR
jgi:hypothetical protein